MLPPHIDTLLLDLDETLLDDDRGMRAAVTLVAEQLAAAHPSIDARALADRYVRHSYAFWADLIPAGSDPSENGRALRMSLWAQVIEASGLAGIVHPEQAVDLYAEARRRTYALFDDVQPFLMAAAGRWQLAILTNGATDTQHEKAIVTGLTTHIPAVFVSGAIGVGKPDPAAFAHVLGVLVADPARTAHVGDSLRSDIEGARASNVLPVWLRRKPDATPAPEGVLTISSLTDLLGS